MERITLVDNSRQAGMQEALNIPQNEAHMIIGCGGIGFWLGIMLAMMGAQKFIIMDGDKIDNSNLSRLPVPQTWIGVNKAVALRKTIRTLRPDCVVTCLTTHITPDTLNIIEQFFKGQGREYYSRIDTLTVWDTTDDARIQSKIHATVKKLKEEVSRVHYRKIGYEGFKVANYANYSVWTQEGYTTGYRTTQANSVSSVISAGMGMFSRYLTEKDVNIDLRELIMQGGTYGQKKEEAKAKPRARARRVTSV